MTEQEIAHCLDSRPTDEEQAIKYLKANYDIGVAYGFMPVYVQEWACDHPKDIVYYSNVGWGNFPTDSRKFLPTDTIALPQDYEPKKEPQGGWVEFDIDNDGTFFVNGLIVLWFNWQHILSDSYGKKNGFTAFGGWQYQNCKAWFTTPQILFESMYLSNNYQPNDSVKPAIPSKIRFWREAK